MNLSYRQSLLTLHGAVLLFALSGLFAKWLAIGAVYIVFGRAVFAALTIALLCVFLKNSTLKIPKNTLLPMLITGSILALHWGSFFHAIQVSSVAIGLITFATFPVFVSFIEPIFFKEKVHVQSVFQALLVVIGIYLLLPEQSSVELNEGVFWGVISAFSFAILTVLNRKYVNRISAKSVAFYQNLMASICLLPLIVSAPISLSGQQLAILILLGVVFTALAHSMFNQSLKIINARTASMVIAIEPLYGILAAFLLLGEAITMMMIVGGAIILGANIWATTGVKSSTDGA